MDDELINSFRRSQSQHSELTSFQTAATTPPSSSGVQPQATSNTSLHANSQIRGSPIDSDNTSSFEELVTVSQGTPAVNVTNSSDLDNWMIVDHTTEAADDATTPNILVTAPNSIAVADEQLLQPATSPRVSRRVRRRRSETALLAGHSPQRHFSIDGDIDDSDLAVDDNNDEINPGIESTAGLQRHSSACDRCGNRKANIRRHVARFKRQLESRNVGDAEMRSQLTAFFMFLERNASVDEGTVGSPTSSNDETAAGSPVAHVTNFSENVSAATADEDDFSYEGDDDGIHVYASDDPNGGRQPQREFFNLTDVQQR